jgi:tetrahydromethanopterin S-methyltransferase subunit G
MTNKKEENKLRAIIWLDVDFSCVQQRIQMINNQIEKVLSKYESELADDFFSQAGSQENDS